MPKHRDEQFLPYTPEQLFDLVKDIERYPEFIPWCRAARIIRTEADGALIAELVIAFNHLSERYTSRVTLIRTEPMVIDVVMVSGPFEYLTNRWEFHRQEGGTLLDFSLDFKFRSMLMETLLGGLFGRATAKMSEAFRERADTLYGSK